jgi:hypothetical protein
MSKLHDDLVNEVEPADTPEDAVHALMMGIADRIEGCYGNAVKLSDLCAVLREDTQKMGRAVINNTAAMRTNKISSTGGEAPSNTFQKQRPDIRAGTDFNDGRGLSESDRAVAEQERLRPGPQVNEPLV